MEIREAELTRTLSGSKSFTQCVPRWYRDCVLEQVLPSFSGTLRRSERQMQSVVPCSSVGKPRPPLVFVIVLN